jgi:uncharacterized membrane protein
MTESNTIMQRRAVSGSSKFLAFLAYLLGPIGWGIAFLFGRNDSFVRFHIRQSIGLWAGLAIGIAAWFVIGGVLSIIPYFGPLLAFGSFALVIALVAACIILWIRGMLNALTGHVRVLPLFGERAERWLGGERRKPKSLTESYVVAAYANLAETSMK